MVNKIRLIDFLMFVLVAALPISKGAASIATVSLIAISLFYFNYKEFKNNIRQYPHVAALGLIAIAYLIGVTYSEDKGKALQVFFRSLRYLIFPVIILSYAQHIKQQIHRYIDFFLFGLIVASLLVIFLLLLPEATVIEITRELSFLKEYPFNDDRLRYGLYSPFIDRLQFSSLLGIGVICSLYLAFKTKRTYYYLSIGAFLTLTSLLLGGRGGQLGLFGGVCVFITGNLFIGFYPQLQNRFGKARALGTVTILLFLLLVVVPIAIYTFLPAVTKRYNQMFLELKTFAKDEEHQVNYEHSTTVRRIVSWQNHWEVIKKNPVLGVGTGHYEDALAEAYNSDDYDLPVNAHSQYLQIWVTLGIWGLILFLGVIFFWLRTLTGATQEFILALAFMVHYGISFLPDALLLTQVDAIAFSLFFCLFGLFSTRHPAQVPAHVSGKVHT